MFRELMPLLEGRTPMLTLSRVDESAIGGCVVSKPIRDDTGENALCTPLTLTGAAEEPDREFAAQLIGYTRDVVKFGSNLAAIEPAHNAALKIVEEEKKKDLERKRGKPGSKTTARTDEPTDGPVIKDGKPVFGTRMEKAALRR